MFDARKGQIAITRGDTGLLAIVPTGYVLMLLRLLRLCGAKAVLLAGADGYKPGTPAYADSLLHAHTGRGAAFNTAMAGAIKACGLDVTFITPSEYAK